MPKILTQQQIDTYWKDGCVFPIRVMSEDDARETVWRYGHSEIRPPEDLTAHWGFDVTQTWFRRDAAA